MRNIETRIHAHQEHIDSLMWNVEWRKNSRKPWKTYCKCSTVDEAEKRRELCRDNRGNYPILEVARWRTTKFRILQDFGYFLEGTVRLEYKQGLGKWHSFGNYADLDVANEIIEKVKTGRRKLHKFGVRKLAYKLYKTCESTVLCIRFPFLYPRNRWTDTHYTNFVLDEKIRELFNKSHECTNPVEFHKGLSEEELYQMKHPKYRITDWGKAIECRMLKIYRGFLEFIHCVPTYTELDAMDKGWRNAFGIAICKEIKKALRKAGYIRKYRIMQIKEKWGELCWYDSGAPKEVFEIIRKYEDISRRTCIECGRPAKYVSTGWVEPYCEECLPIKIRSAGNYVEIKQNQ